MKKFKIKNRPKRKYVRKIPIEPGSSFSRTVPIGLLPMVLVAIAVLMNALVSTQAVDQFIANLSVPTPSLNLPTISFSIPSISISLPQIQFTWMQDMGQGIARFLSGLNPIPALKETGKGIDTTGSVLIQTIGQEIQTIFFQSISFILSVMQSLLWLITTLGKFSIELSTNGINGLMQGLQNISENVFSFTRSIGTSVASIFSFLTMIGHAIGNFFQTLTYYIALPFKILEGYLATLQPFFAAFGKLLQQSGNEFIGGFKALGYGIQEASKLAQ